MDHHHDDGRLALWCASPPGMRDGLVRADPERYFVPPYVGIRGWIGVRLDRGLAWDDVERIIRDAKPRLAIITHFGMTVWRAHPWEVAADLTQRLGTEVKAARDGMSIEL